MLVDPDECAVDKDIFEIGIVAERPENAFPNALLRPPPEASVRRKPFAERFRQIAPRRARPRNPKNRFDKKSVVTTAAAGVTDFTRQLWGNPLPLRVVQHHSNQGWPPFFSLESTFYRFGNPVCKQALAHYSEPCPPAFRRIRGRTLEGNPGNVVLAPNGSATVDRSEPVKAELKAVRQLNGIDGKLNAEAAVGTIMHDTKIGLLISSH